MEHEAALKGVSYLTDSAGRRTAVVLDLDEWGEVWEDMQDALVAAERRHEERISWEELKREMGDAASGTGDDAV